MTPRRIISFPAPSALCALTWRRRWRRARAKKEKEKKGEQRKAINTSSADVRYFTATTKSHKIRDTFLFLKGFSIQKQILKCQKTNRWRLVCVCCQKKKTDIQLWKEDEQTVDVQLSMAVNWFFHRIWPMTHPVSMSWKGVWKHFLKASIQLSWVEGDKPHTDTDKKEAERLICIHQHATK